MADTFLWRTGDGDWSLAADWTDQTGTLALPGSADTALIDGPPINGATLGTAQTLTGQGAVASLVFTGLTTLAGSLAAANVLIGSGTDAAYVALAGGALQAGSLTLSGLSRLGIDAASTLEVGSAGGAAAGVITVDAGATLAGSGGTVAGAVSVAGIVLASGDGLALTGAVSGGGVLEIGAGARLDLSYGSVGASTGVAFLAASGTLFTSLAGFAATIAGFASGAAINVGHAVTSASYTARGSGTGSLSLADDGAAFATLTLAGNFAGMIFQASGQSITLAVNPGTGSLAPPSAGTPTADRYAWTAASGGDWGNTANWTDSTTGATPAAIAPGSNDLVTLGGPGGAGLQVLTGAGDAASLLVLGNTALTGQLATGTLMVGAGGVAGQLDIDAGATVTAGAASLAGGTVALSGSLARFTTAGTLSLGDATMTGAVQLVDHATLRAGSVVMLGASAFSVDATAIAEIGTAGGATPGRLSIDAGAQLRGAGVVGGAVSLAGTVLAEGRLSLTGAVSGDGTLEIGGGATLDLSYGSVAGGLSIGFLGGGGLLAAPLSGLPAIISGFTPGETIDVGQSITTASYSPTGSGTGLLTLLDAGSPVGTLSLAGSYAGAVFQAAGQAVTLATPPACYAAGTRILTPRGEIAVEALRPGDLVVTLAGTAGLRAVAWTGRRRIELGRHPDPAAVAPVRVLAGAFAPGVPHRDLLLSPDHAVFAAGLLVPIGRLVNGATIRRDETGPTVTYVHVELARHDLLLAEGLPAESYLDTGNRDAFEAGGPRPPGRRRPASWARDGCLPLTQAGPAVIAL
ncbi:MAG: Hint domain-containing protein, partial [Rhodospirillales bacterium]|nr:Hint domain-containing protein [Rhodospirillales bacterium]